MGSEEIDEEVFMKTWIPSNLNQLADRATIERELDKRTRGEEVLYDRLLAAPAVDEEKQEDTHVDTDNEGDKVGREEEVGDDVEDSNESDSEDGAAKKHQTDGHR